MKTYTTPSLTEFGDVASITRGLGGNFANDQYLLGTGEVIENGTGAVASDFGCEDRNRNSVCDANERR